MSLVASVLCIPEAGEADPFRDMRKEIHKYVPLRRGYMNFFQYDNKKSGSFYFLQKLLWRDVIFSWEGGGGEMWIHWEGPKKIYTRCTYLNGKFHGECKIYSEDGKSLWKHYFYENGDRHGSYKQYWWDENGRLAFHCNYKRGNLCGEYKHYYNSHGSPLEEHCFYDENSICQGEYKKYHEDGKTLWLHRFFDENGKLHGESNEYCKDGKTLRFHSIYEHGVSVKGYAAEIEELHCKMERTRENLKKRKAKVDASSSSSKGTKRTSPPP